MTTIVPSALRGLSDPANTPEGLTVFEDGRITLYAAGVGGIEIRLTVIDAARLGLALSTFAARNAALAEAPPVGEG